MDTIQIPRSIFGLIGERLDYSFSRAYFTEKFEKLKLKDHEYRNIEIPDVDGLSRFRESVTYHNESRTTNGKPEILRGLNVTIPYKQAIMGILDHVSEEAQMIGAVNTITIEDNKWTGHNTDAYGFGKSLAQFLPFKKNALILGTGGASKAIAFTLESMQIPYLHVSRNPKGDFQIGYDQVQEIIKDVELIVNSTPLGTHPDVNQAPSLSYDFLNKTHVLYDLVYNPSNTLFMKQGSRKGAKVINGSEMLRWQAERAWELWNE
ncbi:MAG: shikimate dehydrogenase [Nonlabens sp.]